MPSITKVSAESWHERTVETIVSQLNKTLRARNEACLAVPGGHTARQILPMLAHTSLAWDRVTVILTDERWVPPSHADSNEKLVRDTLLKELAYAAKFIGLKTHHNDPHHAIDEITARLKDLPWPLSVVFIGMGEDGHIASLFPGEQAPPDDALICVRQGKDHMRVSLTPGALLRAETIVLAVSGPAKRRTLERALQPQPTKDYPVRYVTNQNATPVIIYVA